MTSTCYAIRGLKGVETTIYVSRQQMLGGLEDFLGDDVASAAWNIRHINERVIGEHSPQKDQIPKLNVPVSPWSFGFGSFKAPIPREVICCQERFHMSRRLS